MAKFQALSLIVGGALVTVALVPLSIERAWLWLAVVAALLGVGFGVYWLLRHPKAPWFPD